MSSHDDQHLSLVSSTAYHHREVSHHKNEPLLSIIHFNDSYNVDPVKGKGGIVAFKQHVERIRALYPSALLLFSGDAFSPSILSNMKRGYQMVHCLNQLKIDAACVGNHQFDFDYEHAKDLIEECSFPWLLGNMVYMPQNELMGGAQQYLVLNLPNGLKVGLMGIAGDDWIGILKPQYGQSILEEPYDAFCLRMSQQLRHSHKCDIVIALTHMRNNTDIRLAELCRNGQIDLILGGHDHCIMHTARNGIPIVKSGSDFGSATVLHLWQRQQKTTKQPIQSPIFHKGQKHSSVVMKIIKLAENVNINSISPLIETNSHNECQISDSLGNDSKSQSLNKSSVPNNEQIITVSPYLDFHDRQVTRLQQQNPTHNIANHQAFKLAPYKLFKGYHYEVEWRLDGVQLHLNAYPPIDEALRLYVSQLVQQYKQFDEVIGHSQIILDLRFSVIRREESPYCNFFADLIRMYYDSHIAFYNSGGIRNDAIIEAGVLKYSQISKIIDAPLVVKLVPGSLLIDILEYSISGLPDNAVGSFLMVSGIRFEYKIHQQSNSNDPSNTTNSEDKQDSNPKQTQPQIVTSQPSKQHNNINQPQSQNNGSKAVVRRVQVQSIKVNGEPLIMNKIYCVAMPFYMSQGGDGFGMLKDCQMAVDPTQGITMLSLLLKLFKLQSLRKKSKKYRRVTSFQNQIRRGSLQNYDEPQFADDDEVQEQEPTFKKVQAQDQSSINSASNSHKQQKQSGPPLLARRLVSHDHLMPGSQYNEPDHFPSCVLKSQKSQTDCSYTQLVHRTINWGKDYSIKSIKPEIDGRIKRVY